MRVGIACLLLLGTSVFAEAQPAIHFGGGGTWLDANHDPQIGASVLAPSLLASIATKDEAIGIEAEFKLPLRHVAERAYSLHFGSYVYRFNRREAVLSAFGRIELNRLRRFSSAVLFGGSWITTTTADRVIRPSTSTVESNFSRTRFTWSGGLDFLTRFGCFNAIVPQFRWHFPIGPDPELRFSIGGAITWSPTTRWASAQSGG